VSGAEHRHWSIGAKRSPISETSGAPTASRTGCCQRVERGIFTGATNWAEHRQRDELSTVSERSGASSPERRRRAEDRRRAERSIITGTSELSEAPSASGAEHRHRSVGAERSNISEMSGVPSASGAEQIAKRSIGSGPSGALSAKRRPERSIVSKLSSEQHLRLSPKPVCHHREQLPASQEEHRP
jgi:hypothetical protein